MRQMIHIQLNFATVPATVLPKEWLGEQSSALVSDAVNSLLDADRTHQIRQAFDRATMKLIANLKSDPEMAERAENIKEYLKNDEAFNRYVGEMWGDLRNWMKADMHSDDSKMQKRISEGGLWVWRNAASRRRAARLA